MIKVQMQGRFTLIAHKLDGSSRVVADWFDNLILDNGLNRIPVTGGMFDRCCVGSGTAAASAGQTQMGALVASTTTITASPEGNELASGYCWRRYTFRFGQGAAAGNLSEVGIGLTDTDLFSRARIIDGSGNPTTVTVLNDEFLDVVYELRAYWPTTDVTGTLTINSVSTGFVMRAANVGQWTPSFVMSNMGGNHTYVAQAFGAGATLGTIEQAPTGNFIGTSSANNAVGSYVVNSFSRTFRLEFNLASITQSIKALLIYPTSGASMVFQCAFTPVVPKTNQNVFNVDLAFSWARKSI